MKTRRREFDKVIIEGCNHAKVVKVSLQVFLNIFYTQSLETRSNSK